MGPEEGPFFSQIGEQIGIEEMMNGNLLSFSFKFSG